MVEIFKGRVYVVNIIDGSCVVLRMFLLVVFMILKNVGIELIC